MHRLATRVRDESLPGKRQNLFKSTSAAVVTFAIIASCLLASPSLALAAGGCSDSVNSSRTWEDWLGGARVHASAQFQPTHTCSDGRHVKRAYVRIVRECGPHFDTGRYYSDTASSPQDTTTFSVNRWIFDSVLWGCQTNTYYGFEYF